MDDAERPTKRIRTSDSASVSAEHIALSATTESVPSSNTQKGDVKDSAETRTKAPYVKESRQRRRYHTGNTSRSTRTFTQPTAISTGDRGIFVTSEKGREKNCLLELHDLVLQYLGDNSVDASGRTTGGDVGSAEGVPNGVQSAILGFNGIEADIASELDEIKGKSSATDGNSSSSKPVQLITLDIPCVSFMRFPSGSSLDPVKVVHKICLGAADAASPQQSRFIKRLTPLRSLGKALGQGLERACEEVLPEHFGPDIDGIVRTVKFAIRPTIRNNEQLDRDHIIKLVAGRVQEHGQEKHKVDLKQYEKGIIVEVYRGWVGMCVVDNTVTDDGKQGFEALKRFNLAEIYANRKS